MVFSILDSVMQQKGLRGLSHESLTPSPGQEGKYVLTTLVSVPSRPRWPPTVTAFRLTLLSWCMWILHQETSPWNPQLQSHGFMFNNLKKNCNWFGSPYCTSVGCSGENYNFTGSGKWSWVGLTSPIPVNCLDASCNGLLFWDEDGSAYTHVDNIFSRVAFPKIAGASAVFVPDLISPLSSSLIHRHPSTNLEATICQIQCTPCE